MSALVSLSTHCIPSVWPVSSSVFLGSFDIQLTRWSFYKVEEASKFPDIKIVSFDWLMASINSHVRADEARFSLGPTIPNRDSAMSAKSSPSSKQSETKGKGKKRPRSPSPMAMDGDLLDVADSEALSPIKKHKDVQTARSNSLLVPVDETCPLAGRTPTASLSG